MTQKTSQNVLDSPMYGHVGKAAAITNHFRLRLTEVPFEGPL